MTDLTWPSTIIPAASEWRLIANTASFGLRTRVRAGDRWGCTLSIPTLPRSSAMQLRAFLARLLGHTHRCVLPNHAFLRRGAIAANAKVYGASQTGPTLVVDSVEAGLSNALRTGDFIAVDGRLYMVAADCSSNASGQLTITLTNPIDTAPDDNATVETQNPTGRFILMNEARWHLIPGGLAQFDPIDLLEDIP